MLRSIQATASNQSWESRQIKVRSPYFINSCGYTG